MAMLHSLRTVLVAAMLVVLTLPGGPMHPLSPAFGEPVIKQVPASKKNTPFAAVQAERKELCKDGMAGAG